MSGAESFLEQNMALLRSRYPGLADLYAGKDNAPAGTPGGSAAGFRVETAASGDPVLVYTGNPADSAGGIRDTDIIGILIHSRRDPVREGRRQAEAALAETGREPGTFIVLGFGLGYAACALAKSLGPEGLLIIVERRKELFRLALERRDLAELLGPGRAVFVIGENSGAVTGALSMLEKQLPGGEPVVVKNRALTALSEEDESWYEDAERRIRIWASKDKINAATLKRFGRRWTRNLGANFFGIPEYPGVRHLSGILAGTGIPVFLAAAGPSLNDSGPLLRSLYERCLVVAVDTSLRFLTRRGLEPDFVVSVDPQYWNARHLHRMTLSRTALIAESAVYPPVLRGGTGKSGFGRTFLCRSLFPLGRFIEDRTDPKGSLGAGGSVATTAWDFARLLGPRAVWIAGLDLGFPARQTHFKGALFEEHSHALSRRFRPAETLSVLSLESGFPFFAAAADGGRILTDRRLSLYGAWFENRFRGEKNPVSYSLSPGGLVVPGFVPAEPGQILALPPRREEIEYILDRAYVRIGDEFYAPENRRDREQRYAAALKSLVSGLEELRDISEGAAEEAEKRFHQPETARENCLQKLDRANAAISASPVKDAAGFLFPPVPELEQELTVPPSEPLRRYLEFSFRFYRSLADAAGYTLSVLGRNFTTDLFHK
ncbi:MAG: DUF115 domain-containing protein [Treponema sp.]|jgi:hypothetical protein|nr:DUF115 domain-containing protein [Treponema sp.]